MATLGELLKKEREEAGLNLEKTAQLLRVRQEYLINIEQDNYEKLPPDVYIKGFLKSYATLLDLDEKKVMEVYRNQQGITEEKSLEDESKKVSASGGKIIGRKKRFQKWVITPEFFLWGLGFLVVLTVVVYFLIVSGNFSKAPELVVESPRENETVVQDKITVKGVASEGAKLTLNGQEVSLKEGGQFEAEVVLMQGLNDIKIQAENKFGKITEKSITVRYDVFDEENSPLNKKVKMVQLKVDSEPVWVSIIKGEEEVSETLAAYSEKMLEIDQETKVIVEKANGIYFTENGGDLEIFGEEDEKAERVFNP